MLIYINENIILLIVRYKICNLLSRSLANHYWTKRYCLACSTTSGNEKLVYTEKGLIEGRPRMKLPKQIGHDLNRESTCSVKTSTLSRSKLHTNCA